MTKWVYSFGAGHNEGRATCETSGAARRQPGGNGLDRPARAPGLHHQHRGLHLLLRPREDLPNDLRDQVAGALARIEQSVGARFGDSHKPLLVSVRSGARVSMLGMMDTVLNLGLNDSTVAGLATGSGDAASPGTATAASSRCSAPSSSAWTTTASRRSSSM
jgi:pyruvate,orthophosphate dikinase